MFYDFSAKLATDVADNHLTAATDKLCRSSCAYTAATPANDKHPYLRNVPFNLPSIFVDQQSESMERNLAGGKVTFP